MAFAAGCDSFTWFSSSGDTGNEEIYWYGYILDGPYTGEDYGLFSDGSVEILDMGGQTVGWADQPYDSYEGYWRMEVPASTDLAIHLSADGFLPSLWRTRSPAMTAYWYTGALFAYSEDTWLSFFEDFESVTGQVVEPLSDEICWMWGAPDSPGDWAGATVELWDGDGVQADVFLYTLTDDGYLEQLSDSLAGQVDYFFAFNLAPGDIVLSVVAQDGRSFSVTYPAWGGEVLNAWYLALPTE